MNELNINHIFDLIRAKHNLFLDIETLVQPKSTARCPFTAIIKGKNKKYLLVCSKNPISSFYVKRSIIYQNYFYKRNPDFLINKPVLAENFNSNIFALFDYFDKFEYLKNSIPIEKLMLFYKNNAKKYKTDQKLISLITGNFIHSWPKEFHNEIKKLDLFKQYIDELLYTKELEVCFEHGDFTTNNIIKADNKIFLLDFEFARTLQPIGFDIFDYKISTSDTNFQNIPYLQAHQVKYQLIEEINKIIDNSLKNGWQHKGSME